MEQIRINNFKEKLYYEQLDNGLQIYVVPLKNKKGFTAMMVTNYGARDICFEVDGKMHCVPTGVAHFLEHKMFDREEDPFTFYSKYGTDVNAATSDDYTCYYFVGNKCFKKSLKYLLNWIQSFTVTDQQVKKEQGIILEEASMYKDHPGRVMYNKQKENIYVNDPKRNINIGTDNDIVSITKDDLDLCYKSFYVPNNMYLLVAGNVNPNDVISVAVDSTRNFKKNKSSVVPIYNSEVDTVFKEHETLYMNVGIPKISISYKINKKCFKNLNILPFELDLYLHFLMNIAIGSTSLVRQKWLEKELFTDCFYRITEIESHYVIELHANTVKKDELILELEKYITDLHIDEESFEREKKIWIASEIRATEDQMTTIYNVLDDLLDYGAFIPNKIEYIKGLNFDVLKSVKECLNFNNKTVIEILPLHYKNKK